MSHQAPFPYKRLGRVLLTAGLLACTATSQAFFDTMNPSRWFGGDDDEYYDGPGPYRQGGPGYYGPSGLGPGSYGSGYPGPPYGAPPYGAPGQFSAPGYSVPPAMGLPANPQATPRPSPRPSVPETPSLTDQAREIEALKRRIEELESQRQAPPPSNWPSDWPPSPGYQPMDRR